MMRIGLAYWCCAAITVRTRDNQDEKVLPGEVARFV